MNLRELQQLTWDAIRWPTGVEDFLAHSTPEVRQRFHETFAGSEGFAALERVGVYADAYFWRLLGVLQEQFVVTAWICGAGRFHNLVTDYVLARPSTSPDIRQFGAAFPAFVAGHREAVRWPGLSDVAELEWTALALFVARDAQPRLAAEDLAEIDPGRWSTLVLRPVSTLRWQRCRVDVVALGAMHEADAPAPTEPACGRYAFALWRKGLAVKQRELDPSEAAMLDAMAVGESLLRVFEAAAELGDDPGEISERLHAFVRQGWIQALIPER